MKRKESKKAKVLSLNAIANDLVEGLTAAELSWDLRVYNHVGCFYVIFPINFFGDRKEWLDSKVRDVAKKHGLAVRDPRFRWGQEDIALEVKVSDFKLSVYESECTE